MKRRMKMSNRILLISLAVIIVVALGLTIATRGIVDSVSAELIGTTAKTLLIG